MAEDGRLSERRRPARAAAVALATVLATVLITGCGPLTGVLGTADRPNVVLIVTDDQDAGSIEYMPNVGRLLVEEGTTFENAFVTDSLCCPSRASTLRGQYAHNHGVVSNASPRGGRERFASRGHERSTVATWLQDDGYGTALVGKYLNNYTDAGVPPGWDEWYAISGSHLSHDLNENGRAVTYDPDRHHLDDVLAEKATGYVDRAAGGRPFFVWLGTRAPHLPAAPAPRHRDDFADVSLPRGPSFDEEDVSDKPGWIRDNPPLREKEVSRLEELHRERLRSLQAVDEMVVRLVRSLRETGELDNTYIFFTSDNGFHAGQHRLGTGKWTAYEEDVRVPLIVRGPGVPKGATREHLVLNNDLAPTLADIAGTQAPPFVDGRSLMPLLSSGERPPSERAWRHSFLIEAAAETPWTAGPPYPQGGAQEMPISGDPPPRGWRSASEAGPDADWGRPALEGVRTSRYLYVEYESRERELYDLQEDPHQLTNLLGGEGGGVADPALVRRLEERLAALKGCAGAACRTAENDR